MNTELTPEQVLEMLTTFCGPLSYGIYDIPTPFMFIDYIYATDGRIVVRAPKDKCATPPPYNGPFPPVDALNWNGYTRVAGPEQLQSPTDLPDVKTRECLYCKGAGEWREIECPECCGYGEIECHVCGSQRVCYKCEGRGAIKSDHGYLVACCECGGKGSINDFQAVELSTGALLNRVHLEKIIRFTPQVWPSDPIRFAFDCIEGLAAPAISSSDNIVRYKRDEKASRKASRKACS